MDCTVVSLKEIFHYPENFHAVVATPCWLAFLSRTARCCDVNLHMEEQNSSVATPRHNNSYILTCYRRFMYSPVTRPGLALVGWLWQLLMEVGALTVVHLGQASRYCVVLQQ